MGARRVLFVEGLGDTEGIDFVGFRDLNWSVVNLHQFFFFKINLAGKDLPRELWEA